MSLASSPPTDKHILNTCMYNNIRILYYISHYYNVYSYAVFSVSEVGYIIFILIILSNREIFTYTYNLSYICIS